MAPLEELTERWPYTTAQSRIGHKIWRKDGLLSLPLERESLAINPHAFCLYSASRM
jgi:hypothetical protein